MGMLITVPAAGHVTLNALPGRVQQCGRGVKQPFRLNPVKRRRGKHEKRRSHTWPLFVAGTSLGLVAGLVSSPLLFTNDLPSAPAQPAVPAADAPQIDPPTGGAPDGVLLPPGTEETRSPSSTTVSPQPTSPANPSASPTTLPEATTQDDSPGTTPAPEPTIAPSAAPTADQIKTFILARFSYAHDTNIADYETKMASLGASAAAQKFPLTGAAYATCVSAECETRKVAATVNTPAYSQIDGSWSTKANVNYILLASGTSAKVRLTCNIRGTTAGGISDIECELRPSNESSELS